MKFQNIRLIYLKNIMLFLFFGFVIATITSYIQYSVKYDEVKEKLKDESFFVSNRIKTQIKNYINKIEVSINSIYDNKLFLDYINNTTNYNKNIIEQLFINTMENNKSYFQLRFLDINGIEKIRIDRKDDKVFIVEDSKLQDKSNRYYFKGAVNTKRGEYWYSNVDLNIENKKLEYPIRPTFRVSTKVFHNNQFVGILIVNIELKPLLDNIKDNKQFNIYLIDKDGYFILNPDSKKNWSRYLGTNYKIDFENNKKERNFTNTYLFPLNKYFNNNEGIQLVLKVKNHYLDKIIDSNRNLAYTIGILTLLISIPISLIISVPISKLYIKFEKIYKDNLKYVDLVDKYVISMTVDLNKKIVEVSKALCNISGFAKDELIGNDVSIIRNTKTNNLVCKDLWNNIHEGKVWTGEIENKKKNGKLYWIKTTALPNIENSKILSFSSISEDITDKKIIEKISETDKLTQLYNRIKLDRSLEYEFNRFKRNRAIFSLILIDIDFFKLVNDTFGHQVGDKVLIEVSNILKENCRKIDILGRWGGEEFLIICVNTEILGAQHLAEKLRKKIAKYEFEIVKHKTISLGVSQVNLNDTIESLIKRVDNNLYQAKESGRNQTVTDIY
ncbi:diguanylate cyclase [Halarcobacter sp.]|uniref:sensor domain-containing diguanylate cyclase n=1 Tax=Halarcobacter sp. TaxID=2321133 RepID=UPI0029F4A0D8|nr:diguanylate cyclase [Halarcobacter sp.]